MSGKHIPSGDFPSVDIMARNIVDVYNRANDDDDRDGLLWYVKAHRWAQDAAIVYGVTIEQVAQVIAALSPLTPWERNLELAAMALSQWKHGGPVALPTLGQNARRARAILDGEVLDWQAKTSAFWHLIADPLSTAWVCVDSHAVAIAVGITTPGSFKFTARCYRDAESAYRLAAEAIGILPHHLQAITWCCRRRELHG